MKFLKFAPLLLSVTLSVDGLGQDGGYDHERLTTLRGRAYYEVFVIGSDANGLTFRHRDGIAKVEFGQLSEAYRMLYEAVAELPEETDPAAEAPAETNPSGGAEWTDPSAMPPMTLLARNRICLDFPMAWPRPGGGGPPDFRLARLSHTPSAATGCGPSPLRSGPDFPWTVCSHTARREIQAAPCGDGSSRRLATKGYEKCGLATWPAWWPDHQWVHRLTRPFYRELALRDFLCTSGLLPLSGYP